MKKCSLKSLKSLLTFMIAVFLLLLSSAYALAAAQNANKKIAVWYNNLQIFVDGKELATPVEPFIMAEKGITMVPLRAISEALGKTVVWDAKTASVYIGKSPLPTGSREGQENRQPTAIAKTTVLRNVGPFYELKSRNIVIARRQFAGGLIVELDEHECAETVLDLQGRYNSLEGYVGVDDETRNSSGGFKIIFYGDENEKAARGIIKPSEYPSYLKVDVKGVQRLKIQVIWQDIEVGDDKKVLAALADFNFYQ